MKLLLAAAVAGLMLFQVGCATILKGDMQPISVNSNVDDAEVYINGTKVGETPFIGQVKRTKTLSTLEVKKDGYKTKKIMLDTSVEPVFWVNIIMGGPLGSTTDYASESMWKYAPSTINLDLEPVKKK